MLESSVNHSNMIEQLLLDLFFARVSDGITLSTVHIFQVVCKTGIPVLAETAPVQFGKLDSLLNNFCGREIVTFGSACMCRLMEARPPLQWNS